MKDKLVKTGHKKRYYRLIGALKGVGFSVLAIFALATPVFISYEMTAAEARAEQATTLTLPEQPSEPSETPLPEIE